MPDTSAGSKRRREEDEGPVGAVGAENTGKEAADDTNEVLPASEAKERSASGDSDEDGESDEESDVEFILAPREASKPIAEASKSAETAAGVTPAVQSTSQTQDTAPASVPTEDLPPARGSLDIEAVGTLNGQPISQFPPSSFEDKPWRRPGVDLSDYFNYGFDEFTWMAYCSRQDKLRAHFTPSQVMQTMPMGGMPNPMMGMMPPFMMPMMFPPGEQR